MDMISSWIENDLEVESSGIYRLKGHRHFSYSDGADSEKYLGRVFDSCEDLSSGSTELAGWIKDWRSEYHLSPKRSSLLDLFTYKASSNVLEVGCGCGAISRFLGETFDNVVSIDGSIPRAELARKRCRDLANVHVVAAPFQALKFKKKFDIIFCIGVLEYSGKFVDAQDPYKSIVEYFARHLSKDGVLVIAIENRFGLKYFNSASEDHTGRAFDGIEDYPGTSSIAKTFGYGELREMLSAQFPSVDFYFPFPDYKVPDAVFSEELLAMTDISGSLGKYQSRDYSKPYRPLFSEAKVWRTLAMNGLTHQFSNSFLVLARKSKSDRITMDSLGVTKNLDRALPFRTRSTIYREETSGVIRIRKSALQPNHGHGHLQLIDYDEPWFEGETLQSAIEDRACEPGAGLEYIFEPAKAWYAYVSELAGQSSPESDRRPDRSLSSYFDAIWQNTIVQGGSIHLIDQEWSYRRDLEPRHLLIRALYTFLKSIGENRYIAPCLKYRSGKKIIRDVARLFGEEVTDADMDWLIETESSVWSLMTGNQQSFHRSRIQISLFLAPVMMRHILGISRMRDSLGFILNHLSRIYSRLRNRIVRILGKAS